MHRSDGRKERRFPALAVNPNHTGSNNGLGGVSAETVRPFWDGAE